MIDNEDLYKNYADSLSRLDTIVALLNMKFARHYDNPEKAEVLSEVLNEVKFVLSDVPSEEVH